MEQISFFESDKIKFDDPIYNEIACIKLNETLIMSQLGIVISRYEILSGGKKVKVYVLETENEHEIYYYLDDIYYRINQL